MKKKMLLLLCISNLVFAMGHEHEHISETHFHLSEHFWNDAGQSKASVAISDQPVHLQNNGIQYLSHGADGAGASAAYKDESKQVSQIYFKEEAAMLVVGAKIKECMRFTDIKGILDYQSGLKDKLYGTHPNEHEAIRAELDQLDYQLTTKLAPWVECYRECEAEILKGDWISLNDREMHLECLLKDPDLSSEERLDLQREKDIVSAVLHDQSTQPLMALFEGNSRAALAAWKTLEQWRREGRIDYETFKVAREQYLLRKDVHALEDSSAQVDQESQAPVLENIRLAPSISEQLAAESSVVPSKLEDVTDMTTDKPTLWYGKELSAEKMALFAAYHQEVHDALICEGLIDRDMPRAIQVADLFIETLAHELHPNQIKRDIDGIAQLAKDVAHSATSPINGVQGRSHLGHPHPRVIAALEAGVGGAQEVARRLVTPMEGVDKSPLVQVLCAAGDLTPEQIAIISAKVTADWIKFEALSTVGAYVSQADVLGKVRDVAQRVEKGTLTAEEARRALIADGIVLDVGAAESGAAESTSVLRSQSDKVRGTSKVSGAGKEAVQLSVASEKLSVHQEWFDIAEKVEKRLPQAGVRSVTPTDLQKYLKYEQEAEIAYEQIRQTDDILKIAKNTGLPKEMIHRVKNHVFFETHNLKHHGQRRFFADGDMAAAWSRLQNNQAFSTDILMLKHELAESIFKESFQLPHDPTHELTNVFYDWNKSLS